MTPKGQKQKHLAKNLDERALQVNADKQAETMETLALNMLYQAAELRKMVRRLMEKNTEKRKIPDE